VPHIWQQQTQILSNDLQYQQLASVAELLLETY
jgi:hypothetical protein